MRRRQGSAKKKRGPVKIGNALSELVNGLGIGGTLSRYKIITHWEEIVGQQIARVATPQRVDGDTLYVGVASAPWRAELVMRRREIIEKINAAAGRAVIRDIRFR